MESLFTLLNLRPVQRTFSRYRIGAHASTALLLTGNKFFRIHYTTDGDKMLFNNSEKNGIGYGIIIVEMSRPQPLAKAKAILLEYVRKMRKPLGVAHAVDAGTLRTATAVVTTGYWQDGRGTDWKFKGYTDGRTVAVLYVKNVTEAPTAAHETFLDGFRFATA